MSHSCHPATVPPPASPRNAPGRQLPGQPPALSRGTAGLATLEWLLVIAAAGGFAAVLSIAFRGLIDEASRVAEDPLTAVVAAHIAAARISEDAVGAQISLARTADDPAQSARSQALLDLLAQRCRRLVAAYPGAIRHAEWVWIDVGITLPGVRDITAPTLTTAESEGSSPPTDSTPASDDVHASADELPTTTSGRWVCQVELQPR
ncbi:hypothetical protein [Candidatus Poriferisodalis sp.]|uniref:hypothetical protein n=1 Tax=Candidatus Poriferisodalis sp. TaxID=3101277 RepID=UPI003B51B2F5